MLSQLREIGEAVSQFMADDPALSGGMVLLSGLAAATGLGAKAIRWARGSKTALKAEERVKVNIDAPEGTRVELRVNE